MRNTGIPVASHSNFYAYAGNESTRSNRKGYFYAIPDSFRANMKSYSIPQYERQQHRTITSLSPQSNIVLTERDWCTEFTSVSVGSSPRSSSFTSATVVETGEAQRHSVTEFVPRSTIFCVNRSSVWCGFCVRARPIRYSMNKALVFFKL